MSQSHSGQFLATQPYKGTRDFYPAEMRVQRYLFDTMRHVAENFGYQEYDGPMLEPFELYAAKTGEEIVNQQLYWLVDRGERKMAIRPEMTPTLARMVAGKLQELPRPVRWYSIPNLWRYERPQKGRLREHWQLNVDVLGGDALLADAEVLQVALGVIRKFGGEKFVEIHVNSRRLVDHVFQTLGFSAEVAHGATKALDSRAKIGEEKYAAWLGQLGVSASARAAMEAFFQSDFKTVKAKYPCPGTDELDRLLSLLQGKGPFKFDPMILRGMDYYTGTVFEMYDTSGENRRAMFGGGRYDNLIGLFAKDSLSGVGFGMGDVTMRDFLETHRLLPEFKHPVDVFVSLPSAALLPKSEEVASALRAAGLKVVTPLAEGGFGAQLKLATKHGARFAVLFGDDEIKRGEVVLKDLDSGLQTTPKISEVATKIQEVL